MEIVRAYVEAFDARDTEALLELCDPEVEVEVEADGEVVDAPASPFAVPTTSSASA